MNTILFNEINQEVESLALTEGFNRPLLPGIIDKIKQAKITNVIIAARGSSDHVGLYFKYLFETFAHIPVGMAGMSVVTKYDSYLDLNHTLLLAISQSGSGVDITEYINQAQQHGALTLGITNDLNSIVAKACHMNLYLNLTREESLAATKTFISQMFCALLLTAEYTGNPHLLESVENVKSRIKAILDDAENIKKYTSFFAEASDCYMLGRGFDLVSAFESALKIQETTYIKGKAYAISDFYHGPFAIADSNQNFVVFCSLGRCHDDSIKMIEKLLAVQARVLIITDDPDIKYPALIIYHINGDEIISPFMNIATMQILVNFIAIERGINPDHPRNLKKVTITR